jgi:hypothetical protein
MLHRIDLAQPPRPQFRMVDHHDAGIGTSYCVNDFARAICRMIIHHNDLQVDSVLIQDGIQTSGKIFRFVARGNQNT